jgi:hypothetical protein
VTPRPGARLTFFCELDADELSALVADGTVIAQLAALDAQVSLGLRDISAARARVVQRLSAAGIPVIAWQLLPIEQGYWYNLSNPHHAAARYAAFQAWTREQGLHWAAVGIDIEPDIREVARWFANPLQLAPEIVRRLLDTGRVQRAGAAYRDLIAQMHADNYQVESYVIPYMRDERRVGATLLQRLMGLVDLPTDREVPMLYSSFHRPYGAGLLWSYAAEGTAAGLGSTGGGVDVGGIDQIAPLSWAEFSRDLRLAQRHCHEIYIFSLEGCVRQGFLEQLIHFNWDSHVDPPALHARRVGQARLALRMLLWLSARLNVAWLGLLPLIWLAWRRHMIRRIALPDHPAGHPKPGAGA